MKPHDHERELLLQLSTGDRTAYTRLYTDYYARIFRYLFIITKSKETSEEILQDIFVKVWIKRATLTDIVSLEDYLFRMAKNRLFDEQRHQKKNRNYLAVVAKNDNSGNHVLDHTLLKEYHTLVQQGLAQMPERRREIFRLNVEEELTAREIAERMNLSVPVVKKQLYEAQHFLRAYLKEHGDIFIALLVPVAFA